MRSVGFSSVWKGSSAAIEEEEEERANCLYFKCWKPMPWQNKCTVTFYTMLMQRNKTMNPITTKVTPNNHTRLRVTSWFTLRHPRASEGTVLFQSQTSNAKYLLCGQGLFKLKINIVLTSTEKYLKFVFDYRYYIEPRSTLYSKHYAANLAITTWHVLVI